MRIGPLGYPMAVLLLLLGCQPPTDAERYLAATVNPADPAPCDDIGDAWLAGECRAMAAAAVAEAGDVTAGAAICAGLAEGDPWRDECFFLLSDRTSAQGEQARQLCGRSGRFEDRCLGHAFGREGRAMLEAITHGEELAVYRALREKSAEYFDDPQAAGRKVWHMMVEFIASRDFDRPFSAATCGGLPDNLCQTGFQTRIRFAVRDAGGMERPLHELCERLPVTVEAAMEMGAPVWEADAERIVQGAWRQFCGR